MSFIRYQLDSGCDGVDIRWTSHTQCYDRENYGFSPPVIDEFKRRYGVDIASQPFDREAWHNLRGEYVDLFLVEASKLVRSQGKEFLAHLSDVRMDSAADEPCYLNTAWNWRRWLREGLIDKLTFKRFVWVNRDYIYRDFYREAVAECMRLGIPMISSPADQGDKDRKMDLELIDRAREDGFAIFNLYEAASFLRLDKNGFNFQFPAIWKKVRQEENRS